MGMSQEDLDASQVIIKTASKQYVFDSPSVQKIKMRGEETFQIGGSYRLEEVEVNVKISQEDIDMVSEQAGVSKAKAKEVLERVKGDIAQAIVELSEE